MLWQEQMIAEAIQEISLRPSKRSLPPPAEERKEARRRARKWKRMKAAGKRPTPPITAYEDEIWRV